MLNLNKEKVNFKLMLYKVKTLSSRSLISTMLGIHINRLTLNK